ncbi:hypothetical protein QTP88_014768 [Uroleucon formosanum]
MFTRLSDEFALRSELSIRKVRQWVVAPTGVGSGTAAAGVYPATVTVHYALHAHVLGNYLGGLCKF